MLKSPVAFADDNEDQTNQRISTSRQDDKAWSVIYYCEFNFTIVNLSRTISYVNTQNNDCLR